MAENIELVFDAEKLKESTVKQLDNVALMVQKSIDEVNGQVFLAIQANLTGRMLQERSGALADSLYQMLASRSGLMIEGTVGAGGDAAPYGIYHDKGGTRSYIIRPKNGKALRFGGSPEGASYSFNENGAGVQDMIFARYVVHPPIALRPWFTEPVQDVTIERPIMQEAIVAGINEGLGYV